MQEIITELSDQLKPISTNSKIDDLARILTVVDGTLINALPKMTWALWRNQYNAIKAHTQFDIEKYVPIKITITQGNASEIEVLARNLEPGRIYVKDRGYVSFALFTKILEAGSSFICRLKEKSGYECLQDYELTPDALAAGIIFDKKVRLGCRERVRRQLAGPVRLIAIKCKPNKKRFRNGLGGPAQGEILLIATDIFDLEAEVIGLIFKHRWAVEVFFRFFKHVLGCRHLLSYNHNGIELQTYAAIIACMLIALWTGRKPTLRTYEMLCWYFTGMADEDELISHIQSLQKFS
jgi:hypothetical protein